MRISTKTKYGVKAMYEMAKDDSDTPIPVKEIALRQGLSEHYLEQLIGHLRKAGLVKSQRGARGGYFLAKSPREITVADIVTALDGPIMISDCSLGGSSVHHCGDPECCVAKGIWEKVGEVIEDLLNSITLEDICEMTQTGDEIDFGSKRK